mmetsp:Transcript_3763/g.9754  ORF Transcript_3763/g.9754 Transcript_3763/m.9754 type:complete len:290 (+) Transcript_3763:1121-1990(+)
MPSPPGSRSPMRDAPAIRQCSALTKRESRSPSSAISGARSSARLMSHPASPSADDSPSSCSSSSTRAWMGGGTLNVERRAGAFECLCATALKAELVCIAVAIVLATEMRRVASRRCGATDCFRCGSFFFAFAFFRHRSPLDAVESRAPAQSPMSSSSDAARREDRPAPLAPAPALALESAPSAEVSRPRRLPRASSLSPAAPPSAPLPPERSAKKLAHAERRSRNSSSSRSISSWISSMISRSFWKPPDGDEIFATKASIQLAYSSASTCSVFRSASSKKECAKSSYVR